MVGETRRAKGRAIIEIAIDAESVAEFYAPPDTVLVPGSGTPVIPIILSGLESGGIGQRQGVVVDVAVSVVALWIARVGDQRIGRNEARAVRIVQAAVHVDEPGPAEHRLRRESRAGDVFERRAFTCTDIAVPGGGIPALAERAERLVQRRSAVAIDDGVDAAEVIGEQESPLRTARSA